MQLFDVSLQMWLGEEASLCVFRREYGSAMALEHNGDLYSCGHFRVPRRGSVNPSPLGDGEVGWIYHQADEGLQEQQPRSLGL